MNITLLANYLPDGQQSMQRYAELLRQLLSDHGHTVQVIRPEPFFREIKPSGGLGKWLAYLDKFVLFPFRLRAHVRSQKQSHGPSDFLVHICDHSNAVYGRWLKDTRHLVTCHDLLAIQCARGLIPGQRTGWSGRLFQRWIFSSLRQSPLVLCASEETRQDLLSLAPELAPRSRTIENPLNYPYAPMEHAEALSHLEKLGWKVSPSTPPYFLLHVGGNQWYKNREGVIRSFASLCANLPRDARSDSLRLVMAGQPPTATMLSLVAEAGLTERVLFLSHVSNEELRALYSLAAALTFPSLREGFGWPLIEAQACGCLVVTSNRPPMNRLAGQAGFTADPESPQAFGLKLKEILSLDPIQRQERERLALEITKKHNPLPFFNQIISAYTITA